MSSESVNSHDVTRPSSSPEQRAERLRSLLREWAPDAAEADVERAIADMEAAAQALYEATRRGSS